MCDTLVILRDGAVWFAKNSDREPEEPQVLEVFPPVRGDGAEALSATYIDIPQVPDRHGVILSRPVWMWGAEMGVNDAGVAIGNEALYSKLVGGSESALLGMDLVRLGLERGGSADAALDVITQLLEAYGQGGAAGYTDKSTRYDNSFLIADKTSAWVLETAGQHWAAKRIQDYWAISNTYSIDGACDRASWSLRASSRASPNGAGVEVHLRRRFETLLRPWLAAGRARSAASARNIQEAADKEMSLARLAAMLRTHDRGDGFTRGSNRDVCMHSSGGLFRPSQTTASMIAKLTPGEPPRVAATETPSPCVSLFRPAGIAEGAAGVVAEEADIWHRGEAVRARAAADAGYRGLVRRSIAETEPAILKAVESGTPEDLRQATGAVDAWLARVEGAAGDDGG